MATSVLVVDDEDKLRRLLSRIISLEGYRVTEASSLAAARAALHRGGIDLLLCDVKLPDGNGVDFTKEVKDLHPNLPVILLTAFGNIPDGVRAMRSGAFDYLVKGDDNDKIIPLLAQAAALSTAEPAVRKGTSAPITFDRIIGESAALRQAIVLAKKVAPSDTPVLLTGETGTGKEVFAQAIHAGSRRAKQPFVAINCSAFSKELLESELFGHRAGAFTGAVKDQPGLVDEAAGGTLFLDEIGEMPVELQPKLLRFLESGVYYALGDARQRKADVRIVAATNRVLSQEAARGAFRADLYYRIAVFTVSLPSLRERVADIPALAEHFVREAAAQAGKRIQAVSKEAMKQLLSGAWKGNIRELKNVLARAVILEDGDTISVASLPPDLGDHAAPGTALLDMAAVEKAHICKVLEATKGNKAEAARLLHIGIATLYRKVEEYGLK